MDTNEAWATGGLTFGPRCSLQGAGREGMSFVDLRNLRLAARQGVAVSQSNPGSVSPALGVHLSFGNGAFLGVPFCFCFLYSARCSVLPAAQVTPPAGGPVLRDVSEKDRR